MAVPSLIQRIRDLDEDGAVQLAHALLRAEQARLRLPASTVTVGLQAKAADGGIDARTAFPRTASSAFPTGPMLWQVKSGAKSPDANSELPHTNGGPEREVVRLLRSQTWGYVLFWTRDPSDKTRQRLMDAFDERIHSIAPGAATDYLTIDRIVPLCRQLPAAALPILRLDRGGLLTVEEWSHRFRGSYVRDSARAAISQAIQAHARSAAGSPVLHVTGLPGVGRRRTVLEAAREEDISHQAYVAVGRVDQQLVRSIVDDRDAILVLIVEPDATTDRAELRAMADAAEGRLRLILISDRTRPAVAVDVLEVPPLEGSAIRSLLPAGGTRASRVRECAGYPSIALAIAVADPSGSGELSALMRDPAVRAAVAAVIPHPIPDELAVLALLTRIGYAGPSSDELRALCLGLGLDHLATETALRAYAGSFVSIEGEFASIESRLIAAPLIDEAVGRFGSRLISALAELPDVMFERFMNRIEAMDSPPVTRLIEELLETERFKTATLAGLDAPSSHLLGIATARGPQKVLERVEARMAIRSPGRSLRSATCAGPGSAAESLAPARIDVRCGVQPPASARGTGAASAKRAISFRGRA